MNHFYVKLDSKAHRLEDMCKIILRYYQGKSSKGMI